MLLLEGSASEGKMQLAAVKSTQLDQTAVEGASFLGLGDEGLRIDTVRATEWA